MTGFDNPDVVYNAQVPEDVKWTDPEMAKAVEEWKETIFGPPTPQYSESYGNDVFYATNVVFTAGGAGGAGGCGGAGGNGVAGGGGGSYSVSCNLTYQFVNSHAVRVCNAGHGGANVSP